LFAARDSTATLLPAAESFRSFQVVCGRFEDLQAPFAYRYFVWLEKTKLRNMAICLTVSSERTPWNLLGDVICFSLDSNASCKLACAIYGSFVA
jgi:hypothetical protein